MSRTTFIDATFNIVFFLLVAASCSSSTSTVNLGGNESGQIMLYLPDGAQRSYYIELTSPPIKSTTQPNDIVFARYDQLGNAIDHVPSRSEMQGRRAQFVRIVSSLHKERFFVRVVPVDGSDTEAARRDVQDYVDSFSKGPPLSSQKYQFLDAAIADVDDALFRPQASPPLRVALGDMVERVDAANTAINGPANEMVVAHEPREADDARVQAAGVSIVRTLLIQNPLYAGVIDEAAVLERLNRIAGQGSSLPTKVSTLNDIAPGERQRFNCARQNAITYLQVTQPSLCFDQMLVWYDMSNREPAQLDLSSPDTSPRDRLRSFDLLLSAAKQSKQLDSLRDDQGRRYAEVLLALIARHQPRPC